MQLVLVNPVLIGLELLGSSSGGPGGVVGTLRRIGYQVGTQPLVVMTLAGLAAGRVYPAGLPPGLGALSKQVAAAGPCLGFLSLGFAVAAMRGTSPLEVRHCAVLCALKLLVMPALYLGLAPLLACSADPAFLLFLASMPASASVYSLALTKGLSPRVIGPLVPLSMLLSVALVLEPIVPAAAAMHAGRWLRLLLGVVGAGCAAYSLIPTAAAAKPAGAKRRAASPPARMPSPPSPAGTRRRAASPRLASKTK